MATCIPYVQDSASLITADGAYHCPVGSKWPMALRLVGNDDNNNHYLNNHHHHHHGYHHYHHHDYLHNYLLLCDWSVNWGSGRCGIWDEQRGGERPQREAERRTHTTIIVIVIVIILESSSSPFSSLSLPSSLSHRSERHPGILHSSSPDRADFSQFQKVIDICDFA